MLPVHPPDRILIIDNNSDPPIGEPPYGDLIRLFSNHGFAKASNIGLRLADTDAVLFLNNDIRMTSEDWLEQIRCSLRPGVLVGASMMTADPAQALGPQPFLEGWCLAGMREDFRELGGFDETLREPAYWSDVDLCIRARRRGMRLVQANVGLRHLGNYTTRRMDVSGVSEYNGGLVAEKFKN